MGDSHRSWVKMVSHENQAGTNWQGLLSKSLTTAKGNFNSGIKKNEELSNDIQLPGRDDLFQNKQCNYEDLSSRLLNFTFQIMRRNSDHCLKCGERKGNMMMMSKDTAWFFICWQSSYGWSFHWAGITQKKILKKKWYSSRNVLNYIKPQHMSVFVLFCFLASSHPLFVISLLL